MDTKIKLSRLLDRTEAELQALIANAAQEKDYALAAEIAEFTKMLEEQWPTTANATSTPQNPPHSKANIAKRTITRRAKFRTRGQNADYPMFEVHGQNLIKTGWSKKAKREYSQKAPRSVLDSLTNSLKRFGEEDIFSMEDVLPDMVDGDGETLPSYQVYIALGFLRAYDLVQQHGRQGYSLVSRDTFEKQVEECWNALKTFR